MTTKAAKRMSVTLLAANLGEMETKVVSALDSLCARVEALEARSREEVAALARVEAKRLIRREREG